MKEMTEIQIIKLIEFELEKKDWGITEQILEIHSPILIDDRIQIENIVKTESEIITYLPIINEKFYLAFYIDPSKKEIIGISIEPKVSIYFKAGSNNLSESDLKNLTHLEITKSWNKGDKRNFGNGNYNFSCIIIEPNLKPNDFDTKLSEIISELQKDEKGIISLSKIADGYIQVVMDFHNGNGMFSGPILTNENLKKLSDLDLKIDFDFYISGNSYKS